MVISNMSEKHINKVDTAAIMGETSVRIPSHILLGSVRTSMEQRKIETTVSSKERMKAKRAPEIIPGFINGKVTLKKAFNGDAPKTRAARSIFSSKPRRLAETARITNGTATIVWPITSPSFVSVRCSLENNAYTATAMMIIGTIIGDMRRVNRLWRPKNLPRTSPNEASVPRAVATNIVIIAICRL